MLSKIPRRVNFRYKGIPLGISFIHGYIYDILLYNNIIL